MLSARNVGLEVGRGSQEDEKHRGKLGERWPTRESSATEKPKEIVLTELS